MAHPGHLRLPVGAGLQRCHRTPNPVASHGLRPVGSHLRHVHRLDGHLPGVARQPLPLHPPAHHGADEPGIQQRLHQTAVLLPHQQCANHPRQIPFHDDFRPRLHRHHLHRRPLLLVRHREFRLALRAVGAAGALPPHLHLHGDRPLHVDPHLLPDCRRIGHADAHQLP